MEEASPTNAEVWHPLSSHQSWSTFPTGWPHSSFATLEVSSPWNGAVLPGSFGPDTYYSTSLDARIGDVSNKRLKTTAGAYSVQPVGYGLSASASNAVTVPKPAIPDSRKYGSLLASQENPNAQPQRPVLFDLLHRKEWHEALMRCRTCPSECAPVILRPQNRNDVCDRSFETDEDPGRPLYLDTALGVACRNFSGDGDTLSLQLDVVREIWEAHPDQIRCDQLRRGQTPLLDAACNPDASPELIAFLVDADRAAGAGGGRGRSASLRRDENGLLPLDHLLAGAQRGVPCRVVEAVRRMVRAAPELVRPRGGEVSPLVRLLTQRRGAARSRLSALPGAGSAEDPSGEGRVLDCAEALLSANPGLIRVPSVMTGCTPLHLALRNGRSAELVELFLKYDPSGTQCRMRNSFGDLPLHVAVSVGVAKETLRMVVERTLVASGVAVGEVADPIEGPNPLIWSVNGGGYTPLQLAWMRQMEEERGCPMIWRGAGVAGRFFRNNMVKKGLYYTLLSDASREICKMLKPPPTSLAKCAKSDWDESARQVLGPFWDTLILLLQTTYLNGAAGQEDFGSPSIPSTKFRALHAAAALPSTGPGPYLPVPIFEIALEMCPNEVHEADEFGRLPLHCAAAAAPSGMVQCVASCSADLGRPVPFGWAEGDAKDDHNFFRALNKSERNTRSKVQVLLQLNPRAASVSDGDGRLPLNFAIESEKRWRAAHTMVMGHTWDQTDQPKMRWGPDVTRITMAYPAAIDRCDPLDRFYPFMLAAVGTNASIDIVYDLLRRSPARVMDCYAPERVGPSQEVSP